MLNPSVGSMVLISSPLNFFKIVVFPALSRPLRNAVKAKIMISFDWLQNESFTWKTRLNYKYRSKQH